MASRTSQVRLLASVLQGGWNGRGRKQGSHARPDLVTVTIDAAGSGARRRETRAQDRGGARLEHDGPQLRHADCRTVRRPVAPAGLLLPPDRRKSTFTS